ncbi:MAG TPA: hypothetical protein RMH85_28010 [Polyangiaceae bacterium LLY-WYZ-15_(1-7)]|nr:hypothetical protein [Polyangiaceae bacterium LLY-WYZ-15_(1-7)]HJL12357.1 hypothetical protein [Polyangiaceae bacterium LLY-WYZ-15_(1-7)]HJL24106.1 hypothetical protein [Polyangiaceae bacterium LLY-WYZ-15_(1-7)]HJL29755.1 hypothetical protein [Polyangiaceae bacterium LLY-WYZ-15_(1-7)]HJL36429.1 hypothetical protein [Polyangiaceae bacterium LLY-WYZ-15_(1-7)]
MLPSDGVIRWLFEAWAWLQRRRGGPDEFRRAALITPTGEDFPVDAALEGEELAEDYFLFVHEHARLPDWPLVPVPERLAPDEGEGAEAETETEPDEAEVLVDEDELPVPYDLRLLEDPRLLVAAQARGVGHWFAYAEPDPAPAAPPDPEAELLADLASVFLGFGLFAAHAARPRVRAGLLPGAWLDPALRVVTMNEHEVAFALALFGILREVPDGDIEPWLTPNARVFHRKATKHILRFHGRDLARLRGERPRLHGPYR